jgi:hypothetical protein
MRRKIACLVALLTALLGCSLVSAQTVFINFTDRGSYTETGFHNPSNPNYVVGDNRGFPGACGDCRNFFVFDLSSVVQPIASAKLALFVPSSLSGPDTSVLTLAKTTSYTT